MKIRQKDEYQANTSRKAAWYIVKFATYPNQHKKNRFQQVGAIFLLKDFDLSENVGILGIDEVREGGEGY